MSRLWKPVDAQTVEACGCADCVSVLFVSLIENLRIFNIYLILYIVTY